MISLTGDWNAGRGERLFFRTNLKPSDFASGFFESRKQLTEGKQRYNDSFCNAIGK